MSERERVFISQPMKGLSNEEIEAKRAEAIGYIKACLGVDKQLKIYYNNNVKPILFKFFKNISLLNNVKSATSS